MAVLGPLLSQSYSASQLIKGSTLETGKWQVLGSNSIAAVGLIVRSLSYISWNLGFDCVNAG